MGRMRHKCDHRWRAWPGRRLAPGPPFSPARSRSPSDLKCETLFLKMGTLSSWDRILGIHVDLIKLTLPAGSLACVQIYANDVSRKKFALITWRTRRSTLKGKSIFCSSFNGRWWRMCSCIYWLPSRGGGRLGHFSQKGKYLQLGRQSNQSWASFISNLLFLGFYFILRNSFLLSLLLSDPFCLSSSFLISCSLLSFLNSLFLSHVPKLLAGLGQLFFSDWWIEVD